KLKLRRFLNMSVDITVSQLFYENDENNYKNDFKFYESYLRLLTFPMILRIITGKENVFGHPQVHRLMCFKAFVQLIMKKEHDSNSISAMEEIYKIVLQNNQACGIKPVLKMHNPKHYGAYIRELGSLRCFMTTTGENANQIHKKDNFNTRDVC